LTIAELALEYLDWAKKTYVKNGVRTSESVIIEIALKTLVKKFGVLSVNDFGPVALRAVRDAYVEQGLARSTINVQTAKIRRMFRWAVSHELCKPEVAFALGTVEGLKRGRTTAREPKPTRPPPKGWLEEVLPMSREPYRSGLLLQRLTGMRVGELLQMRPCDVDQTESVWWYVPPTHKTEHHDIARRIALGPKAQEVLAPLLEGVSPKRRIFIISDGKYKGRPITHNSYSEHLVKACENAGVDYFRPHSLRHLRLTEVRNSLGIDTAQAVGGHAKIDQTAHYARLSDSKAEQAAIASG